jgi:hypothetical protein
MAVCALGASGWAAAQGGPPMLTDDAGTPGNGNWEINIAATRRHGSFGSEQVLPLLDINYGWGERVQLKYEVPWVWANDRDRGSRFGVGNPLFGIKVRFVDGGAYGWRISTYPQYQGHSLASRSVQRGLAEERTALVLPFEFQRSFGRLSANFEVGREFRSREPDEWATGLVIGHEWTERVEAMAELHVRATEHFKRSALALNVGGRFPVGDLGTLLASVGSDLRNALDERAFYFAYLGWQMVL